MRSRDAEDKPVRQTPKGRREADAKLRRSGRACPVCVQPLTRIAGQSGLAHRCAACGAQLHKGKRCAKCHEEAIWEVKARAACQACGHHGSRVTVVVGVLAENKDKTRA
jgi:predicted amidophosphoribosyltransferase